MKFRVEVVAVDTARKRTIITVDAPDAVQAESLALKEVSKSKDTLSWSELPYNEYDHFFEVGSVIK